MRTLVTVLLLFLVLGALPPRGHGQSDLAQHMKKLESALDSAQSEASSASSEADTSEPCEDTSAHSHARDAESAVKEAQSELGKIKEILQVD